MKHFVFIDNPTVSTRSSIPTIFSIEFGADIISKETVDNHIAEISHVAKIKMLVIILIIALRRV